MLINYNIKNNKTICVEFFFKSELFFILQYYIFLYSI